MKDKVKIFGFECERHIKSWREKFECDNEDCDYAFFISKETFRDNTDNLDFEYKLCVDCYYEHDRNSWCYSICLVPLVKYISKKGVDSVLDMCGYDDASEIELYDLVQCGCLSVEFGSTIIKGEKLNYDIITDIANVFESMNEIRGYYFSLICNQVGNTWKDILEFAINGKKIF